MQVAAQKNKEGLTWLSRPSNSFSIDCTANLSPCFAVYIMALNTVVHYTSFIQQHINVFIQQAEKLEKEIGSLNLNFLEVTRQLDGFISLMICCTAQIKFPAYSTSIEKIGGPRMA